MVHEVSTFLLNISDRRWWHLSGSAAAEEDFVSGCSEHSKSSASNQQQKLDEYIGNSKTRMQPARHKRVPRCTW
jgi:hypothetical protein